MTLEQITKDTCTWKIQAMRLVYPTDQMEQCRNCQGQYYVQCERYKAIKDAQIPFRKGGFAYAIQTR